MKARGIDNKQASTQLLFSTVRVESVYPDGGLGAGTAFFFKLSDKDTPAYLVTNHHVIAGAEKVRLQFHVGRYGVRYAISSAENAWLEIRAPERVWMSSPEPEIDLAAVSVERLVALADGALDKLHFVPMGSHGVPSIEEQERYPAILQVAMIGYPTGLWDEVNNLPVIRRGSTATHPAVDFNGRPEVVVDIACFPGSSGSPIVFYDRDYFGSAHRFLGVLYAGPTQTATGEIVVQAIPTRTSFSLTPVMIHLGFAIKSREVVRFIEFLADK